MIIRRQLGTYKFKNHRQKIKLRKRKQKRQTTISNLLVCSDTVVPPGMTTPVAKGILRDNEFGESIEAAGLGSAKMRKFLPLSNV